MIDIHRVTRILCIQLLSLKISIYNETITLSMPQVYLLPPKVASRFLYYLFTFSLNTQHKIYTFSPSVACSSWAHSMEALQNM